MTELYKKISWEQGLFLQPQHFQLMEAYYDNKQNYYNTHISHQIN